MKRTNIVLLVLNLLLLFSLLVSAEGERVGRVTADVVETDKLIVDSICVRNDDGHLLCFRAEHCCRRGDEILLPVERER